MMALALVIAIGFFIDGKSESFTNLSSDQFNILTVCLKKDKPDIFQGDLVADNYEDVAYYTPFFVDTLRFFAEVNNGNYLAGFNWLNFTLNFFYIICWFALFRQFVNFPLAIIFALLSKGIMWPPGNEVWGIHSLWTLLPRSIFQIAMALVVLCWWKLKRMPGMFLGALLAGITVNLHPISGLGLVCAMAFLYLEVFWNGDKTIGKRVAQYAGVLLAAVAGMMPFVLNYVTNVQEKEVVAFDEFYQYMFLRIPHKFFRTFGLFNELLTAKWLLFIWLPLLFFIAFYLLRNRIKAVIPFRVFWMIVGLYFSFIAASLAPYPLESILNDLGFKGRFAFQLGRNLKYLILPAYLAMAVMIAYASHYLNDRKQWSFPKVEYGLLAAFVLMLFFSKTMLQPVPLLGDDLMKTILPNSLSSGSHNPFPADTDLDNMMSYIQQNTTEEARFVAPAIVRVATERSVVFDYKGASMLIEGNPSKYVIWARQAEALAAMETAAEQAEFFDSIGADYWLTNEATEIGIEPEVDYGVWSLYRLR